MRQDLVAEGRELVEVVHKIEAHADEAGLAQGCEFARDIVRSAYLRASCFSRSANAIG